MTLTMTTPPPEGVIFRHLADMRLRNLSANSIYNRRRALARLSRYLDGPILYADAPTLRDWQDERARQLTPSGRGAELSNVREFYRWAQREGYRPDDPTTRLPMPRAPRRVPRPIADRDLLVAMASAEPDVAVILALAAFAGLRACEIARLDWSEVALREDPPMLRVVAGKGGHGRLIPISPALRDVLTAGPRGRGPVIQRRDGQRGHVLPHRISSMANEHLHACELPDTLHQARHRLATSAYRACRDLLAVQGLLGHSSPTTTAGYASSSPGVALDAIIMAGNLAS
jgi:site-specific recombinase XerD